jgi:DNA-binding NarL/FixJ family response regulator
MAKPMITIHNTETDEIVNREMTDQEYIDYLAWIEKVKQDKADLDAKQQARESALAKLLELGLTESEIAALNG